jgi:hypothetical protein
MDHPVDQLEAGDIAVGRFLEPEEADHAIYVDGEDRL